MASFFRGVRASSIGRQRDAVIKESLINNLSECVKAIQFNHQVENCRHQIIGSNDLSNSLCCALEAIFLHGIRDSIFKKAKSAFTGDIDHKPQPSFWPLILILSHSNNIKHIASLQQISTEIGQCRAWLRMALNDCLLSSYIATILRNMNSTKSFYSQSAFIRDSEMLDVAQGFLEGIESCTQFDLPINSSLLNMWPEDVLVYAGLWTPTMRSCPIAAGVDVASTLTNSEPESATPTVPNRGNVTGLGHMLAMDPEEAFNYIISTTSNDLLDSTLDSAQPNTLETSTVSEPQKSLDDSVEKDECSPDDSENAEISSDDAEKLLNIDISNLGNSLSGKSGWSSDFAEDFKVSDTSSENTVKTPDLKTLNSLVDVPSSTTTVNLSDVMRDLHKELKLTNEDADGETSKESPLTDNTMDDPVLAGLGFEVISKVPSTEFDLPELNMMLEQIGCLSREYGLDNQDYQCINCHDMLGTKISKAQVCSYSGKYYCSKCMDPNVFMIPARVIHNWDFKRYPVSKRAALFLLEFQHQPLLNIKKINPLMYSGVDEMATLRLLRIQLNFLRAYLFTCREPVIEELQKRVWPREYLYEHVHVYSVSDLAQIPNGSLANQLQKVVSFAMSHVYDCWLCSQKGFICEVCRVPKVLYPFDVNSTYRCEVCSSVFHLKCLNSSKPCPKCKRKEERLAISLNEAVHLNIG